MYDSRTQRFLLIILFSLFLSEFTATSVWATGSPLPFYPGEKLVFQIKWAFIPAGEAVLEVLPTKEINGEHAHHFRIIVKTYPYLDAFYKVRDRISGYADLKMTRSLFYEKHQREGKTHRRITVDFDWENNKAHYTNFDKKKPPVSLLPGAFDPLSAFYFIRNQNLNTDTTIENPVTDGKKCVLGKARVIRRETVKLKSGTFDTFLVEPDLSHAGGVFEKSKDAGIRLWITADNRKIPVKIESEVIVGHFVGELVSITNARRRN